MKIVNCTYPCDTPLGEIHLNVKYLVLAEWTFKQETRNSNSYYDHYGVFMNEGVYYDFFINRFEEVRVL